MLKGKNAVITGARKGIGRATVEAFARNGANVWACARTPDSEFEAELQQLAAQYGVWVKPVYFDLADEAAMKEAAKGILKEKLPVDVLVNNAGVAHGGLLQMTSMQAIRDVFEVNFFSQVLLIQLFTRAMMRQKSGAIVNLSSVAGLDGDAGYVAYGSSKAALAFATKTLSQELAPHGIRVNAVAPGLIETHMMELMEESARAGMVGGAAMKRTGKPSEIADAIVYLASEQASFITGQILRVDGGL